MQLRVVFAVVALTLGLLLATSHADDVTHAVHTRAVQPQKSAGSVDANSSGFLSSMMRDADDGEYVIFNSKGHPEAAVVVTKDAAKATEESNIRSIHDWMQRYIANHKNAVTSPPASSPVTVKKTPPSYPAQNYPQELYYAPPPPFAQYGPAPPYAPYAPPGGYYPGNPNDGVLYQQAGGQEYPQEFYNQPVEPPKGVKDKNPYLTHAEVIPGGNKRPLHVYGVLPHEYPWSTVQKAPQDKTKQKVVLGAHTTPNGKPWPPTKRLQKTKNLSLRFPVYERNDQIAVHALGYTQYANTESDVGDSVSVDSYPTKNHPRQHMVAPSQNMIYRSWLTGQNTQWSGGSPFYDGSDVTYNDETMSAYLLSKFAPYMQQQQQREQGYRVKSVVKNKKKNNAGASKGPEIYLTRKQVENLMNAKRYSPRPQYYPVETVESTPQMFSRYGPNKDGGSRFWQNDGVGSVDPQQSYAVQGLDGIMYGNERFDALKAVTGYTRGQGDHYLRFYSPQDVDTVAKYSTGYGNKNTDSRRLANFPQLYLFPSVDRNTQTVSLYGGAAKQQVASPNRYMDVMRNVNYPQRYQTEVSKPVAYKAANQELANGYTGYGNEMFDQGRNVDYQSLLSFLRGVTGVPNKNKKIRQKSPTVKTRPRYVFVNVPAHVSQKDENVRAMDEYTKAQVANFIASGIMRQGSGGVRYKQQQQPKPAPGVTPWQQFRNSERRYSQYYQPWRETFAMQSPVMEYGY